MVRPWVYTRGLFLKEGEFKVMERYKSFIRLAIEVLLVVLVIIMGVVLYKEHTKKMPEVQPVASTSQKDIRPYFPKATKSDIKDISHQVTRVYEKETPEYRYYTTTVEAADKQAQAYAKQDKADKVLKTTTERVIQNEKGEPSGSIVENNYYSVNLNRKHDIKVGGAYMDDQAYASISYRNRDVEYTGYKAMDSDNFGAGVSVAVAKW